MDILNGFAFLFSNPTALMFVFVGAFTGIVAGAIPGLTASAAIAMLMPVTFYLDPLSALAFLYVVGKSGRFGGSIAAILFNTPGTTASAATMRDGYPMTRRGKAGKALKMAAVASVFGDFFGDIVLIFGAVIIASYTARFGPPEYFAIYMMAFVVIGSVIGKSIIKGILSTLLGIMVSLIGLDPITGDTRMTMGRYELENGLALVPLLIGIFVFSEIFVQAEKGDEGVIQVADTGTAGDDANGLGWREVKGCFAIMLRSSGIGSLIGMMPGLGSAVACFVAYGSERRRSKTPEKWGTGIIEGIAAPESANNAVSGPSMIPLLTLGVPGSTIAAILIGVFTIHGIQVGPSVFQTDRELIFGLFAAGLLGIALYGLMGYFGGPIVGRAIAYFPPRLIYPFIFLTAFIASYSARQSIFDVGLALFFGVVGYLMRRADFSAPAFIIAFVLAKGAEEAFRQSLLLSNSGIGIFLERPVAIAFFGIGLAVIVGRSVTVFRQSRHTSCSMRFTTMADVKPPLGLEAGKSIVDSELVGEAWTPVQPGTNPVLYGHVDFAPKGSFEVRSLQTFTLTFTVGRFGLDDSGAIRILFRAIGDSGRLQSRDPKAENYVSATASNGTPLRVHYVPGGVSARPRRKSLSVSVAGGYLSEGDTITVIFGDTSGGSPGMRLQTFVEEGFEFKVLADVCAVGHFVPIPNTPSIAIVPGLPVNWSAVLSSLRRPGESFIFGLKAEDKWGNPTEQAQGSFTFETTLPVNNLPERFDYHLGKRAVTFEGLSIDDPGELRITVCDEASGDIVARSHPMMIREGQYSGYWADLHGQSGESIGIGTSRAYFDFARDCAFLDATSHQANDFQVNNAFWAFLNELTAHHQQDHRFVTFPGYEWSGNTGVGGDRNVYFRDEGRQIRRSSHALLPEREDIDTDATDANQLFKALADEDCVIFAHVGGRYADIDMAHDPRLETAMEIHSAWGTFEWLLTDGFKLGHRSGVVCNSDGHKGRPGASYPGAGTFGAYGGLTCFYAEELTRDGIFDCLRKRHHFGTTGTRMHMDVQAVFPTSGQMFDRDPNAFSDAKKSRAKQVMMGDIVQTDDATVTLKIDVATQSPIERIEIRNGTEVLKTVRGYKESDLGNRIRVIWSGAEYRGRGRETNWKGSVVFAGSKITKFSKINAFNHERLLEQQGDDTIAFDAITTGNFGGFDAWLEGSGLLVATTNHGSIAPMMAEIDLEDMVMEAGGLDRKLRLFRLPDENTTLSIATELEVKLKSTGDNPIWICVTTEDGFQAWSSPIYIFK